MKTFLFIFLMLAGVLQAQINFTAVMVDTNGAIQRPTNFWLANSNSINSVVSVAAPSDHFDATYWFSLHGQGPWTTAGTAASTSYVSPASGGFGGGMAIWTTARIGTNVNGAALRLNNDVQWGSANYVLATGGLQTLRARIRRQGVDAAIPAMAFVMGGRTSTNMWAHHTYGLYFVQQPTNSWASNAVVAQHDRISVSNVVWAVATAGTNDSTEPTWTDLIGSFVTNGSAVYVNAGPHTSNNWVLAIGHSNASGVIMTNTGKVGPPTNNRQEVVLKIRTLGTTNTPYTIYGSVTTGAFGGNSAGESIEVELTTTNNSAFQPQFWSRWDGTNTAAAPEPIIRYFSIEGSLGGLQ